MNKNILSEEIPEFKTLDQENRAFKDALRKEVPYFGIRRDNKYGCILYDLIMYNIKKNDIKNIKRYELKNEAVDKLQDIWLEMSLIADNDRFNGITCVGTVTGEFPKVPLDICRVYAAQIREIIFNKNNWISIPLF